MSIIIPFGILFPYIRILHQKNMSNSTEEFIDFLFDVHGGLDQWNSFSKLTAQLKIGGLTWSVKGHEGKLDNVNFEMYLRRQEASFSPFILENQRSVFTPDRVAIQSFGGKVLKELFNPRETFEGHEIQTPWNKMQLIYFSSYATWSYLVTQFLFRWPGFQVSEIEPWDENGEQWRRLVVIFPEYLAYHSKKQIYYFDDSGHLKRHDYWPEILGGAAATQYTENYCTFNGINIGTSRKVFILNEDNSIQPEPVLVTLEIENLNFS